VTDAGGRQRAVQLHLDAAQPLQQPFALEDSDEIVRCAHRPDGMRAGRPDTDLEQVEDADGH
jgi:hypothetical protein